MTTNSMRAGVVSMLATSYGFVDDLVLLAESAAELQKGIDIVGPGKSAVMIWGDAQAVHFAANIPFPRVNWYK